MRNVAENEYGVYTGVSGPGVDPRSLSLADWHVTFTEGRCWELALTVSRLTGWEAFVINQWHVVVKVPRKGYLDITGIKSKKETAKEWGNSFRTARNDSFFGWDHGRPDLDQDILELVALKLLDSIKVS